MKRKIKSGKFRIKEIKYNAINKEKVDHVNLQLSDEYEICSLTDNTVVMLFIRNVFFNPKQYFNLKISYELVLNLIEVEDGDLINENYIILNIENIFQLTKLPSFMVNLIANISSANGGMPIITPMYFIK